MPIIFDPDLLVDDVDIVVNTTTKTIEIKTYDATTNPTGSVDDEGATGGVTGQALYSWLKEQWKSNVEYIKFPFPIEAITPEQFEFINGWLPAGDATRKLIRTAGWAERDASAVLLRQYMGVISLGTLGATDQPYYRFNADNATNFTYAGPVNEAVQIYGNIDNGNFNYTLGDTLDLYCREQGKTYGYSNNTQIGATTLTYITYRFPLSNATDLNIATSDADISTLAPWTSIDIEYFETDQMFAIGASSYPFRIVVDGALDATTQEIYEKIQWSLRQDSDIDAGLGTVNGKVAGGLLTFVGATLVTSTGVFIDRLNANFLNSVDFYDQNDVLRRYPFVAAGNINFGSFAGAGDFQYWMFFDTGYGTVDALVVDDADGIDIAGTYAGASVPWTFAYDTNTQGGRTPETNAAVTVVGIGLDGGQFISVGHTITRSAGQNILVAPAQERNYNNPV